jgi:hypothetical protein
MANSACAGEAKGADEQKIRGVRKRSGEAGEGWSRLARAWLSTRHPESSRQHEGQGRPPNQEECHSKKKGQKESKVQ